MYNIVRFYNQNRRDIWKIVIIIASLILLLQLLNWYVGKTNSKKQNLNISNDTTQSNSNTVQIKSQNSAVTGGKISNERLNSETDLIEKFLENCNNNKIEEAYGMLTEECKEELYPTVEKFNDNYCEVFLNQYRASYEIENWFGDTYKVDIVPDILATGKSNNNYKNQDYITIKKVEGEYKLNINRYIGRTSIEGTKEQDGIFIKVNYKDVYMDYEKYNITARNNTNKNIFLDSSADVKTMYLEDKNEIKYPAITNEIEKADLRFIGGEEKTLNIKYYTRYSSSKTIMKLVFSNVILDSDKYQSKGSNNETLISVSV